MYEPIPHGHITHKLRRSLIAVVCLSVLAAALLASTVALVTYNIEQTAQRSRELAIENVNTLLEAQQEFSLPEGTSYVPTVLDKATLLDVIAKNQPAVVRIVAMYCGDITLSSPYAASEFADTCSGRVGSGSFISSDGYIATSGHGTTIAPRDALLESLTTTDAIDNYLNYLISARLLSTAQSKLIKTGLASGTDDGQATFDATIDLIPDSYMTISNETLEYAVQLSDDPVRIERTEGRLQINYTNTVVRAQLIDKDYDQAASEAGLLTGEFASSDVALLKADGSFPYIPLGSIDTVTAGDRLTAIGFPAALEGVDSSLIEAVPSITQGRVKEITTDAAVGGRKIIDTTVPIGQGNSGGPALNDAGEQIGLSTYSVLECPELNCFGDGQIRDVADLKALLVKNDIVLQTGGVTDDWNEGLAAYTAGDYSQALKLFTKVKNEYPANYLVSSLLSVARAEVGSATDASTSYQARVVIVNVLIVVAIVGFVISVVLLILIIHFTRKHRREA